VASAVSTLPAAAVPAGWGPPAGLGRASRPANVARGSADLGAAASATLPSRRFVWRRHRSTEPAPTP